MRRIATNADAIGIKDVSRNETIRARMAPASEAGSGGRRKNSREGVAKSKKEGCAPADNP